MMLSHRSLSAEVMKRLTPSMFQVPSSFCGGLGAAGAHVGPGVGLGEHHRGDPALVDDQLGDLLVALVAVAVDARRRTSGRRRTSRCAGLAPSTSSPIAQLRLEGARVPPSSAIVPRRQYSAVHPGLVALLERRGDGRGVGLGVEDRRVAVGVGEGVAELAAGHPVDLAEDRPGGVGVDVREGSGAEDLVTLEHLEEVELDVAHVALVVAHWPTFSSRRARRQRLATDR